MKNPMICTFSGRIINPLAIRPEEIDIKDIAHALSLCNRFAGHTLRPISVAQHSVWASWLVGNYTDGSKELQLLVALQALLHDAAEAYLGDVTKWLKATPEFTHYREAEEQLQQLIYYRFNLPKEDCKTVKKIDNLLVRWEMSQGYKERITVGKLNPAATHDYPVLTAEEVELFRGWDFWSWEFSEQMFLQQFNNLYHNIPSDLRV